MKSPFCQLLLALVVTWLTAADSLAQSVPPAHTNVPAPERLLVIVETSSAMQKRAENTQKMLGSVLANGLKGQLPSGSTVGLWTFNETLFTGRVPLQVWTPETRQPVALALMQALQQQKNEKTARLASAWGVATNIVAQSEHITLLLFTSGSEPITGTPFDASIAESFARNNEQQRKANMPFVTILRAAQGKFVAHAVNMPPWPLEVPEWPEEFKPAPVPQETKPAAVVTAPPPAVKRIDPAVLSPTNTIYLVEPTPPVETNVVIAPPPVTNSVGAAPKPEPPPTNAPVGAVSVAVETKPKSGSEPKAEPKPATHESAAPAKARLPVITLLIAGIGVLLGIMVLFIALLRRARRTAGESLITRSMNQRDR